ncbi:MAG: hypothetical protein ACFE8F_12020 [Promethearchaeota archaeon]
MKKSYLVPVGILLVVFFFSASTVSAATYQKTAKIYTITHYVGTSDTLYDIQVNDGVYYTTRYTCLGFYWGIGWVYRIDFEVWLRTSWSTSILIPLTVTKIEWDVDQANCQYWNNEGKYWGTYYADWEFHALDVDDSSFTQSWYEYYKSSVDKTFTQTQNLGDSWEIETSGEQWRIRVGFRMGATAVYVVPLATRTNIDTINAKITYTSFY